ncbi:hypothetical protein [Streptomyces sp. NBC_01180]|uniref:hypothetical protein n=1 Tax=Streptomyces sp. NBC_01180 TaxID=2903763 RepID=UPI00386F0B60|nr:hypothetical protein OG708_08950 [Streptomyces sp. NBC_01180]
MSAHGPVPIDFIADSEAVRDLKAANGAMWYALRNSGMPDEQITNSLATYTRSVRAVATEEITAHTATGSAQVAIRMTPDYAAGWRHGMATAARKVAGE